MRILLNLNHIGLTRDRRSEMSRHALCREILSYLAVQFDEQSHDKEAYIYEEFEDGRFMLGCEEPLGVLKITRNWNKEIREEFVAAVDSLCHISKTGKLPDPASLPVDNSDTYRLVNAARELDNNWFDYASHAVLYLSTTGETFFACQLDDVMLKELETHPEDFAIAEVYVK